MSSSRGENGGSGAGAVSAGAPSSTTGLFAVEAQMTSTAQRHLQVRFGPVRINRGDGWALFEFQPLGADDDLGAETQRLVSALVRDVTGRSSLRLSGEDEESNFGLLNERALSFSDVVNTYGSVGQFPGGALAELPDVPAVKSVLEMLYNDVAVDVEKGLCSVKDFPKAMCPTGERFDVLLKKTICVKAYSQTNTDPIQDALSSPAIADLSVNHEEDDDETNKRRRNRLMSMEASLLNNSFSVVKLPEGGLAKIWIDTHALSLALSSYSTASVENELPALWRSKSFTIAEAAEVLKYVHEALVGYWNNNTHNERTRVNAISLLSIVSGDLREFLKSQILLQSSDWRAPWRMDIASLKDALQLCRQWNRIVGSVLKSDWVGWDGGSFHDESFDVFSARMHDVVRVRETVEAAQRLDVKIPDALQPETIFADRNMTDIRGLPNSVWESCMKKFEKEMTFLEPEVRTALRSLFDKPPSEAQVRRLKPYATLLRREGVQPSVSKEMEGIAKYLVRQLDVAKGRFDKNVMRATTDLQRLRCAKSCQAECTIAPEDAYRLFGPASPLTDSVSTKAREIIAEAKEKEAAVMQQWAGTIETQCKKVLAIEDAVVVELDTATQQLSCRFNQTLHAFLQEVHNIRSWTGVGAASHKKEGQLSEAAENTVRACEQLATASLKTQQSVANYNAVQHQMIPCTRPMLQPAMQRALSQILYADTTKRVISVVNYQELEGLNMRFQNNVESLSSDNRHIRRFHSEFVTQVMALHNVDLTKHMDQWRSAVDGMRSAFSDFNSQHRFENTDEWRRHWDAQIYKALEYQYRKGLESLHENMEEFKVELIFKQGVVQFKPSFEAIREAYYIKMREFVSVPLRFRGLQPKREAGGTYELYPEMPVKNSSRIQTVHTRAIELFNKLNRVRKAFRSHIVVGLCGTNGAPDVDSIVDKWAGETGKFIDGFRTIKEHVNKMNRLEETMKVDCFSISTVPVKASIDEQLRRLEESLLNAMRRSIQTKLSSIDDFVYNASNVVERQPATMDEVGQANKAYHDYLGQMDEYEAKLAEVEESNEALRQHSGASLDLSASKVRWEHLREAMSLHTKVMEAAVNKMRVSLDSLIQKFLKDVQRFATNWGKQKATLFQAFREKKPENVKKVLRGLKDQMNDMEDLKRQGAELELKCEYFNQPKPNFILLTHTVEDVDKTASMWGLYDNFEEQLETLRKEDWLTFRSHTYQFDDFCQEQRATLEKRLKQDRSANGKKDKDKKKEDTPKSGGDENVIADYLLNLLKDWNEVLPLLKFARGDGWMTEHWNELFRLLEMKKGMTSTDLTFGDILDHYEQLLAKQAEVKQLHARALGEIQLREALQDLRTWALEAVFTLIEPTEGATSKPVKLITEWKEVMTQVSDNQALVTSLKDSPFFVHFADEATGWETKLIALSESLILLNTIQRKWTYLEPIFARGALPQEQARFKRVDKEFVGILREVEADPRVMSLASQPDFNDKLRGILEQIERCQKSLVEYLDAKRDKLPRFYFISDEDLLEILGHSQNPSVIQTHLKKLFMGINSVEFNEEQTAITHMVSADRERVPLIKPVPITDNDVEDWLIRLDDCMKQTLHKLLTDCVAEKDPTSAATIKRYPSQILQVAEQVFFARLMEDAIKGNKLSDATALLTNQLNSLTGMAADMDDVNALKVKALILDVIHNIEVSEALESKKVANINDWFWQKQLRYYMDADNNCRVQMIDASFAYTYEYQGNAAKLVHTPLTDKCYLILTKGMNLGYGGNPYGPAGTGKTESVKALGSAMGRQVLVFNCDEGIDFKSMGRIFVGIVKCGAWGCFDEFNRLKIDQLSAISQMIQVIQEALKNGEETCPLLGKAVDVDPNAGIFVTLNPAGKGYGGRTKLPDNLKQLFREVAMSKPDNELITSTMLLSEGFTHAKTLAKSIVELYQLCGQLMSQQQHYDWGLRPLKAVLRLGGTLVQRWKKENPGKSTTPTQEAELILQSLNINTLSKLTFDDARLFNGLIKDIFPDAKVREISYAALEEALKKATAELGLQNLQQQQRKALQLYEAMNQRMGVVLVGPSGSGKSTLIKLLRKALEVMGTTVPLNVMNPKAMPRRQLLGYMDPDTREWYDGVLTAAAREAVKEPKETRPWIMCDGDVDPEWIESLNSVLDDNKLLTMPNGVRIQFGNNVNFIFETHSLEYASPATVSRMGVLFFSEKDINLEAVVDSVMQQQPEATRKLVTPLVHKYAFQAIDEVTRMNALSVPTTRMGLLNACLNHVMGAANEQDFVFAMLRGLGSTLKPESAPTFAKWLYTTSGQKPYSDSRPLDSYYNAKSKATQEFTADLSTDIKPADFLSGHIPMIRTVEVQRLLAVLKPLVDDTSCKPFFVVGPEGCGKGSLLQHCFASQTGMRTTFINCSAQTNSTHVVQKLEQMCTLYSTNTGRVYRPREGERLVIVLKNINLPKPDRYGTVELHSFLQQLVLYRGFYNSELEWIGIEKIQLVASLTPSLSAGRYPVSPRLLAVVNIISMPYPSKASLSQIYSTYWRGLLKSTTIGQGRDYENGQQLANYVIGVYEKVRRKFEGEEYSHFLFCPRHITNLVANVLLYKIDTQTTLPAVLAYESNRIFADCLPKPDDRHTAEKIFAEQLAAIGYSAPAKDDKYATMYVTWLNEPSAPRTLQQVKYDNVLEEIEGGLLRYSREFKVIHMPRLPEVISWVTRVDRVLSKAGGHVIVVGRPGVGRRDTVVLAAYMQRMEVASLNMTLDYNLKNFRNDMRGFIQRATTQNARIMLILEDHNIVSETFLEYINGLVSSGEIPGLFTSEEMETMLGPLREEASNDGYIGPIYSYFVDRLKKNLRIALIMDNKHELFLVRLQSNPGLLSKCELLWMGSWTNDMTKTMCKTKLADEIAAQEKTEALKGFHLSREMLAIHEAMAPRATPKDFEVFCDTYKQILELKSKSSEESIHRLETGLAKLKEGEESVETIKKDVAKKKKDVEKMQKEADKALDEIQKNMQSSQEQRDEATELQEQLKEEHEDIIVKRQKTDDELSSIKPLMEAARDAVSSIRSEQLNEIRSLKSPPEPVRDVLEGVLALLGVNDVSWQSMRAFLGERGVKERILDFDVKNVTPKIRESVSRLLTQKASSFKSEVIHRASVAAAPMAEWVKAMIQYSTIMERIAPLTRQLEQLEENQKEGEHKLEKLKKKLKKIDELVEGLREEFSKKCKEAEKLRSKLEKAEGELKRAEELLSKLTGEKTRWANDAAKIREANDSMPKRALIAAAFITYLGEETEDVRERNLKAWSKRLGFDEPVKPTAFMRTEGELLEFKAEGLPGDELSLENAVVLLDTLQTPLIVDPANQTIEWAKVHLKSRNAVVEVASMHDERFAHTLELAIRFGKTLLVTEVSEVAPILYPILRRDLISAGAKRVVQVGNKAVDWQDTFRILLFSRSTDMNLPPGAVSLITEVNFSVTSLGLESQLLGLTIQHERPELEEQKKKLVEKEEALKLELSKLEQQLLNELANSQGNLLENTQLITSLNEVKTQAASIQEALKESQKLQKELDEKRNVYRPFAHNGSLLYFLVKDLERLNRMYQFGLQDFVASFTATLRGYKGSDDINAKISALVMAFARDCFNKVSLGLFKKDRLVFGLHLLHKFFPKDFPEDQWNILVGAVRDVKTDGVQLPAWAPVASKIKYAALASGTGGTALISKWDLNNKDKWTQWMGSSAPETTLGNYSVLEQLILVNAFRPDRMAALSMSVILKKLGLNAIVPTVSIEETIVGAGATTPVLLITSSGADPSLAVQSVASQRVGKDRFTQIALGGGQTDEAMQQLRRCAAQGDWIFLKNLHLVLDWASTLEKELCSMQQPNPDFRLIITTEQHDLFPSVLLQMSSKVSVEAPPGIQQNLLRTYSTWDRAFVEKLQVSTSQILFGLSWFHAVVQERRTYVPQGWSKYYEFSPADLKAATDVILSLCKDSGSIDWTTVKGVLKMCIYGGRLDNNEDDKVLLQLIHNYFSAKMLVERGPLFKDIACPASNNYDEIIKLIRDKVPSVDDPAIFWLPANADRAVQENAAAQQTEDLRALTQNATATPGGSSESYRKLLQPVLDVYNSSGINAGAPPRSISASNTNPEPMEVFFVSEVNIISRLMTELAAYYGDVRAVAEGTLIPSAQLREEVTELLGGRMPGRWLDRMDGPKESKLWLSLVARKYNATVGWLKEPLSSSAVYDLVHLLRPQTFFNALRQHTARKSKSSLVELELVACMASSSLAGNLGVSVKVKGSSILLQGALLASAGGSLSHAAATAPSSAALPGDVAVGWVTPSVAAKFGGQGNFGVPVYTNALRESILFVLTLPCASNGDNRTFSVNGVGAYVMPL